MNRYIAFLFAIVVLVCALYRIIPFDMRPEWLGAPQLALAIFAGSVIENRKWAFALPLFSLIFSDVIIQALHMANPSMVPGFYKGQFVNYLLILATTVIGFFIHQRKPNQILAGAISAPIIYFLLSNTSVWISGGGYIRPKTMEGFFMALSDGLPFLKTSLAGTVVFSVLFFGLSAMMASKKQNVYQA
jgi:hypothetical protein